MGRAYRLATKGNNDALVLDSSAADTNVGENLLLEPNTVGNDKDSGYHILIEDAGTETSHSNLLSTDQMPLAVLSKDIAISLLYGTGAVSYTHLTLPTNREV